MPASASKSADSTQATLDLLRTEISFVHAREFPELSDREVLHDGELPLYAPDNTPPSPSGENLAATSLLTPHGERTLFRRMNYARFRANQERAALNPRRPAKRRVAAIQSYLSIADAARAAIVQANLRLVLSLARKYADGPHEFDDLVSEGNLILLGAVDKFDYSRGFRFSTYATHAIQRHFFRWLHRRQRRRQRESQTPNDVLSDTITDRESAPQFDPRLAEIVLAHLPECLDQRERVIVEERFGLTGVDSADTLQSVARRVGLSKERVRQIQGRAVSKLQDLALQLRLRPDGFAT